MADTIRDKANTAIESTLDSGQSIAQGDMQVSKANLRDAYQVLKDQEDRNAQKAGRRPLFRNINMNGMQ